MRDRTGMDVGGREGEEEFGGIEGREIVISISHISYEKIYFREEGEKNVGFFLSFFFFFSFCPIQE